MRTHSFYSIQPCKRPPPCVMTAHTAVVKVMNYHQTTTCSKSSNISQLMIFLLALHVMLCSICWAHPYNIYIAERDNDNKLWELDSWKSTLIRWDKSRPLLYQQRDERAWLFSSSDGIFILSLSRAHPVFVRVYRRWLTICTYLFSLASTFLPCRFYYFLFCF